MVPQFPRFSGCLYSVQFEKPPILLKRMATPACHRRPNFRRIAFRSRESKPSIYATDPPVLDSFGAVGVCMPRPFLDYGGSLRFTLIKQDTPRELASFASTLAA